MQKNGYKPPSDLSIEEAYTVFRLDRQAQRVRPTTMKFYEWTLCPFFAWLASQSVIQVGEISSRHIRAYFVEKQVANRNLPTEREASPHYIHDIARAIRTFTIFCVNEEWIDANPMRNVKMPRKPKKILEAYTQKEIAKFLAGANEREQAIIYFLLDTGVRISECCNVKVGDVRLKDNCVLIRDGKGEKDRYVYFGAKTARMLIRVTRGREDNEYIWPNSFNGKRMQYRGMGKILRSLGQQVGIDCTAHKFRRTFAINCLRNGMDIFTLARLMGHSDISILKPYLDLLQSDLKQGHQQYGVVDNL